MYLLSHHVCSVILSLLRIFAFPFEMTHIATILATNLLPKPWTAPASISRFRPILIWFPVIFSAVSVNIKGRIQTQGLTRISLVHILNKIQIKDIIVFQLHFTRKITHNYSHVLVIIWQWSYQNQCPNLIIKLNKIVCYWHW